MRRFLQCVSVLYIVLVTGCHNNYNSAITKTSITINGDKWFINDKIINEGSPAEGLLMNVREVSNEYKHGGYSNWKDGAWLISTKGQTELIGLAKSLHPTLLVSTSGMGDGQMNDSLVKAQEPVHAFQFRRGER